MYFEGVVRGKESNGSVEVWVVEDLGRNLIQRSRDPPWFGYFELVSKIVIGSFRHLLAFDSTVMLYMAIASRA